MPVLIPKDYSQTYLIFSLLNISFVTRGLYNYFLVPIYFHKKTRVLPKIYAYTTVVQIIISVILIKYFNIWGAIWANLITKIIQDIFLFNESRKFFTFNFNVIKLIILPLLVLVIIIVCEYFASANNIHIIHLIELLMSFALVWLVYRKELRSMQEFLFYFKIKGK